MKKIAYVIPYFGKLPKNFPFYLISCEKNPTIDWLLFTDDKTEYNYPENVKVTYMTFEEIKEKVQKIYDFEIVLDRPYKLCDYKIAYGEIFEEELKEYDFWGCCDMDLLWGDIRKFITDDILEKYEKVGDQGHSSLYLNTKEVNARYRSKIDGLKNYEMIYTDSKMHNFDESVICKMYQAMEIPYYKETVYAHLNKYESTFYLGHLTADDVYKNRRQVFTWKDGTLTRFYLDLQDNICTEEYMYIHFWCRPMTYKTDKCNSEKTFVMYPDVAKEFNDSITVKYIKKHGHKGKIPFLIKTLYFNRKKITLERIIFNIKSIGDYRKRDVR